MNSECAGNITFPLKLSILSLHGLGSWIPKKDYDLTFPQQVKLYHPLPELFVTVSAVSQSELIQNQFSETLKTQSVQCSTFTSCEWGETLKFSTIYYHGLELDTALVVTVWDIESAQSAKAVGRAVVTVFDKNGLLRTGRFKLPLIQCDSYKFDLAFGKEISTNKVDFVSFHEDEIFDEADRLERLEKTYAYALSNTWLDELTKMKIAEFKKNTTNSDVPFIYVEFPEFQFPVYFSELPYSIQKLEPDEKFTNFVVDAEGLRGNPAEALHVRCTGGAQTPLSVFVAQELKPNTQENNELMAIIQKPFTYKLELKEKQLLLRFAFHLSKNKKALTKFLLAVDWSDEADERQALMLMRKWEPIDIDASLGLLTKEYPHVEIRRYAVERLKTAPDESLVLFLLQLVEAMQYDTMNSENILSDFLMSRALSSHILSSYFFWYLSASAEENEFYKTKKESFYKSLDINTKAIIDQQIFLCDKLSGLQKKLKTLQLTREKRVEIMKQMLSPRGDFECLYSFPPFPLQLSPTIYISGIYPEKCKIFNSAKQPLGIAFKTKNEGTYSILFKNGDDLRQDQLIIQIITLMDSLLKKENLDLKLSPYPVLAFSSTNGMLQLVPDSRTVREVCKGAEIQEFLRSHHPQKSAPYGIEPQVLDNFVKSCAGYCVITHILGIGDRHLDNLMVTTEGRLFHIDFGFMLGHENKPFPPPMKLCGEMVRGMGGLDSPDYQKFKQLCVETYRILRKSANLIINLFALMMDSKLADIASNPEKAMLRLEEKFRLNQTDAESARTMHQLIDDSLSSVFPILVDKFHNVVQYWNK